MRKPLLVLLLLFIALTSYAVNIKDIAKMKVVVIPVQFSDVKFIYKDATKDSVCALFNGPVTDYFKDNFPDRDLFSFSVTPVVSLIAKKEFYGDDFNFNTDAWVTQMVTDACKAAYREGVDFSEFDGDNNGVVDNVFIMFAGYNQSESGVETDIYPQQGNILSNSLILNGMRFDSFCCYSEFSGSSGHLFAGPGTVCHELSHLLGLMDLYDVNGEQEGLSNALFRQICLMDYGNLNNFGRTPPFLSAVERESLSCLDVETVEVGREYELKPIRLSGKALRIDTHNKDEYFLLEYRDNYKWDANIGGKGLLIYHIDKSENYAGYLTANIRWHLNAVNCVATHPCAALFDASGKGTVEQLFYPAGASSIFSQDNVSLLAWDGTGTGVGLKDIAITEENTLTFNVVEDLGWRIPYALECKVQAFQRSVTLSWSQNREFESSEWVVKYSMSGKEEVGTVKTDTTECTISNLKPGTDYQAEIVMYSDGYKGKSQIVNFSTIPELSAYALIAEMKGRFVVGESVRLHIINLGEETVSEKWYVNGEVFNDRYLQFNKAGKYTIRVEFSTEGKNKQILEKTVIAE